MHDAPLPASHARGVQLATVTTDLLGAQAQGGQRGTPMPRPPEPPQQATASLAGQVGRHATPSTPRASSDRAPRASRAHKSVGRARKKRPSPESGRRR